MTGVGVDGHARLAQTSSDLDGIAIRMRGGDTKIFIFLNDLVERTRMNRKSDGVGRCWPSRVGVAD